MIYSHPVVVGVGAVVPVSVAPPWEVCYRTGRSVLFTVKGTLLF
jgi:hypothetical protein